jgi:hypothetical protein
MPDESDVFTEGVKCFRASFEKFLTGDIDARVKWVRQRLTSSGSAT